MLNTETGMHARKHIQVRCSEEMHAKFSAKCAELGLFVQDGVLEALSQWLKNPTKPKASDPEDIWDEISAYLRDAGKDPK